MGQCKLLSHDYGNVLGRYVCRLETVLSIASRPLSTSLVVEKILYNQEYNYEINWKCKS